jgi:hypothetical protein
MIFVDQLAAHAGHPALSARKDQPSEIQTVVALPKILPARQNNRFAAASPENECGK